MSADPLLPHVRTLLTHRISSIAQLELLLFMYTRRHRAWTAAEASTEFRISVDWTREQLETLLKRGLLRREGNAYRFDAIPEVEVAVADLAHAYQMFPVTVVSAIYTPGSATSQSIRNFADAFRIRPERRADETEGGPPDG